MKKTIPLLLLMSVSNLFANGPLDGLDINFNETEPRQYEYCEKMIDSSTTIPAAAKYEVSKACGFGLDDARRMAERFGGGNGMMQGYFRGYTYGMHDGYEAASNDVTSYNQGQGAISGLGNYMESGLQDGINKGNQEGKTDGASEVRVRFDKAVDSGVLPSRAVSIPTRAYTPMQNAYGSLVPADQRVPTVVSDIVKNHDEREMGDLTLRNFPVYSQYDATTWGEVTPLTWWDLWRDDGSYAFSKAYWYNDESALNTWIQRPIDTKPRYQALVNVVVNDVNQQRINLQAVFHSAFREAYKYYINYYFAKEFKRSVDLGLLHGKAVGTQLGKRVSFGRGLVAAFNKKFEDSARQTYNDAYKNSFTSSFNLNFDDYLSNPKLEFMPVKSNQFLLLTGEDNDGVIQPGESFSLQFKMKNAGGADSLLQAILSGDVLNVKAFNNNISKISTKAFNTNSAVAEIDSRLQSGDNARLTLRVNGKEVSASQYVTRLVKITASPETEVDALKGLATVSIIAQNVSTIQTPSTVSATVMVDGKIVGEANVGKLQPGQTAKLDLKISGIDPVALINGALAGKIGLNMGEVTLETTDVTIQSKSKVKDLVNYFSQLINNRGVIPSHTNRTDRTDEVKRLVVNANKNELQNHRRGENIWKRNPDQTVSGMLRTNKQVQSSSEEANQSYDKMAKELWTQKKVLPSFIFIHAKRNAFKKILKDLTMNGSLKD